MSVTHMDEFKQRQREMWAAGDYGTLSELITDVGELVVARARVDAGMTVLDVACGTGNAALPAARTGASVTGLDLVPELLDRRTQKAAAEGLEIEWVEGTPRSFRSRTTRSIACSRRSGTCSRRGTSERRTRWRACAARAARSRSAAGRPRDRPATFSGQAARTCRRRRTSPRRPSSGERRSTSARCSARLPRTSSSSATRRRSSGNRSRTSRTSSWIASGRW